MDLTQVLLGEKHLEAIGWTLAHSVWQIALAGLFLWIILKIIPKKAANIRYWAGLSTLALILITSCWTFIHQFPTNNNIGANAFLVQDYISPEAETYFPSATGHADDDQGFAGPIAHHLTQYLPFLTNLWLVGALFYLLRMVGGLYDLQKLKKGHRESVSDHLLKKVDSLTASLGIFKQISVLKSSSIHVPITYGIFKPVVLLPVALVLSMDPRQLEAIIAHELAHIKRHDYLINLFQSLLEVLFFYHPCFWWINEIIQTEREYATDDLVLSLGVHPKDLAYGLATVVNHSSQNTPEMALAASSGSNPTLERIKRVLGKSTTTPRFSPLLTLTMITTLIAGTILMVVAQEPESNNDNLLLTQLNVTSQDIIIEPIPVPASHVPAPADTIPPKEQKKAEESDEMPVLNLTPVPKLDFEVPPVAPVPPVSIPPSPKIAFWHPDLKPKLDSLEKITKDLQELSDDQSESAQSKRIDLEGALADVQKNIEELTHRFRENLGDWEPLNSENMKKFQEDMKVWQEEYQKNWETNMAPRMEEFQEKIRAWQEENEPRIKEFQERMKAWHEANKDKFNWEP